MSRTVRDDGHVNARGNSYARRARKNWLLSADAGFGGDGHSVPCWQCGTHVDYDSLVVDRIIPFAVARDDTSGELPAYAGTYRRENIRPQCFPDSYQQGYALGIGKDRS